MFTLAFSNLKFESQKLFLIWQKDVNCCWVKNKGKYGQYNFLIRIQFYNQTCWTSLWFIPINCKIYLDILGKFTNEHIYHILLSSKIKLHWNCTSFNRLWKHAVFRFCVKLIKQIRLHWAFTSDQLSIDKNCETKNDRSRLLDDWTSYHLNYFNFTTSKRYNCYFIELKNLPFYTFYFHEVIWTEDHLALEVTIGADVINQLYYT